jgi:hypothetical protein
VPGAALAAGETAIHVHLPKPLHGWRQFVGEVGIIVVGVLVALGAEQLVEAAHWRSEVAVFRQSLDTEIAIDLGGYKYRMRENGCVEHRLDELQQWLQSWREGHPAKLAGPIGIPASLSPNTSVWASRSADVVAHMPPRTMFAYADLYDEFSNNEVHRLDERAAWLDLADFDGAADLDHDDLMRLQGLITRARFRDQRITLNAVNYFKKAARMGIESQDDPTWAAPEPTLCRPVLPHQTSGV